jgi:glycosidase
MLRAPMLACPDSLEGQLEYIRIHWASLLPKDLLEWLLLAEGIMKEEARMRGNGPGPARVLSFRPDDSMDMGYPEPEAFSHDKDWMSNVVLIAKTVYVWLDQLSKKHQRLITRLDQIPDEELERLARWGFTGLWLIGVWERSSASQRIKQISGNPEAVASAYSLYDYRVSEDLGGDEAYKNLRARAWRYGIRLASDMVPNHMGIYSKWVIEHPDWFMQLDYPPYPCYSFNGVNLSEEPRVGIYIEDGYWDNRDASVVFKRVDNWTGETRYIYHGNDGTSMPWNDTAQLNFMIQEVREAVIQTVLHVARMFPIIRFDAAMTLAKKHYQRLWFPKSGDGGAIPSRAEHGMSKEDFDRAFPKEFWREVVDRIQSEVPETLLLAEAFWLMEGYFVRTLGMHRVYNSAFMNMLKMEENSKYRQTVKNVLEFSPEVIKRFVNFMNNPDERTAVDQFGKEDKYYGVAVLMVTMPGLPMFGHGQIEGFTEKYGMEYRRAYWDEQVDEHMVSRHEAEIFPLMRKRKLFSGSENFAFFDACVPEGWVDENVYAYSNRSGEERGLILYNNAYSTTRGSIRMSTAINVGNSDNKSLVFRSLSEALALNVSEDCFYVFRDYRTGMEYLRHALDIARDGMFFELHAYQYNAFLDWREIHDADGSWRSLCDSLNGRGVPCVSEAYREQTLRPLLGPFKGVMNAEMLRDLADAYTPKTLSAFRTAMESFLQALAEFTRESFDVSTLARNCAGEYETMQTIPSIIAEACPQDSPFAAVISGIEADPVAACRFWNVPLAYLVTRCTLETQTNNPGAGSTLMDEWFLTNITSEAFRDLGFDPVDAHADALLVRILVTHVSPLDSPEDERAEAFQKLFDDICVQRYLRMNRHEGVLWLSKEQLERMVFWFLFKTCTALQPEPILVREKLAKTCRSAEEIVAVAAVASYDAETFLSLLQPKTIAKKSEEE